MLVYYGTQISPNQIETAEGFLICRNVPIARTGRMEYLARELKLDGYPDRIVSVNRLPEDVFDAAALASFEGKPVTDGHPPEDVGPENYSNYLRGHVEHVRRDGDFIVADLYINDAALISEIQNGVKREVSCGYLCDYTPDGSGYRQRHIRGNHVAVVLRGRAGHEVAIKDAAQEAEKGTNCMNKFKESVLAALGVAAKDATTDEEMAALISTTASVLDAAPEEKKEDAPEKKEDPASAGDGKKEAGAAQADLKDALDAIRKRLEALENQGKKSNDEAALDALIQRLGGDAAAVIPADDAAPTSSNDAAVELLRRMRAAVAAIKDAGDRARVVDALVESFRGQEVMDRLNHAAQAGAQKAADAAKTTDYEKICAEQQAAYYARNPHKSKEG